MTAPANNAAAETEPPRASEERYAGHRRIVNGDRPRGRRVATMCAPGRAATKRTAETIHSNRTPIDVGCDARERWQGRQRKHGDATEHR